MIMQWKKKADGSYNASWQGIDFVLFEHPKTKRWHLNADNKHVAQNWHSVKAAMNGVETSQQRVIMAAMRAQLQEGGATVASA